VLIDPDTGQVRFVILEVGGFLGLGAHQGGSAIKRISDHTGRKHIKVGAGRRQRKIEERAEG
jgi:hypothetical protein